MDFNDVQARLERTMSSIKQSRELPSKENVKIKTQPTGGNTFETKITFGDSEESEISNKIMNILHNLANFKDNLKNAIQKKGLNPEVVEDAINKSIYLQVLIDLVNQEKHGYPLKKFKRSNKNPRIENVRQAMQMTGKAGPTSFLIKLGEEGCFETKGDCTVVIEGDIVDEKGVLLFSLDTLIYTAQRKWEELIKNNELAS